MKLICKSLFKKHMEAVNFDTYYKGFQPPPSEQEDKNDDDEEEDTDENEVDRQDAGQVEQEVEDVALHQAHQEIEEMDSELNESEFNDSELFQVMINDDIVAEEELITEDLDEETNSVSLVCGTPEVPVNSFDSTVHFDRSAGKKRALNIDMASGSETDNDGSTFIEYEEEVPPYMQLRLNNIAEREAAMKAAEEQGLF